MPKGPADHKPIQVKLEVFSPPPPPPHTSPKLKPVLEEESDSDDDMSSKSFDIDKLNDKNYNVWVKRMNAILELKELAIDLDKNVDGTQDTAKARKAYNEILLRCDGNHVEFISSVALNDSVKALHELKRRYEGEGVMPTLEILQNVLTIRLDKTNGLQSHIDKIRESYKMLTLKKIVLPEIMQVANLMISLPADYANVMAHLIQLKEEDLKFEKVASIIMNENRLLSLREKKDDTNVASAAAKVPIRTSRRELRCTYCNVKGHTIDVCYAKHGYPTGHPKAGQKRNIFKPRNGGNQSSHFSVDDEQEDCEKSALYATANAFAYSAIKSGTHQSAFRRLGPRPNSPANQQNTSGHPFKKGPVKLNSIIVNPKATKVHSKSKQSIDDSYVGTSQRTDLVDCFIDEAEMQAMNKSMEFYALLSSQSRNSRHVPGWLLDSGASVHMSFNLDLFTELRHGNFGTIKIANGTLIPIRGNGKVRILVGPADNQLALMLNNVAYAPDLHVNLLSVNKLNESHNAILFASGKAFLKVGEDFIEFASFLNNNYMVSESTIQSAYPCAHEWHRRLAHRNLGDIRELKKHGMTITRCNCVDQCDACMKGKTANLPFPNSVKPESPLDVIVTDLCGPLPPSLGGSRYFMVFVDVSTDFTAVKFLKQKSEAKVHIKNFVEHLKTQLNRKMKVLRSDGGGEYVNHELQEYLASEGIKFETTVRHTPSQNGIAERKMRTLNDAVRTLLIASKLPEYLWAEAMNNAVYTQNRIIRSGKSSCPIELFMGRKARATFMEFGRPVYVTTLKQGRGKYDPHAEIMRFLSVDDNQKGFRLWNGSKIIIERNVKPKTDVTISYVDSMTNIPLQNGPENQIVPPEQETAEPPEPRRSKRIAEKLATNSANVSSTQPSPDPTTYKQALACDDREEWLAAMKDELNSLENTGTYTLADLPPNKTAVGCKWVFKKKKELDGVRYKARLVAKGFSQKYGEEYSEVFSPVARAPTIRLLLSMAGKHNHHVRQLDVKTAFLNGDLKEEIYMKLPPGFETQDKVMKLCKSLYGLKQAARSWNQKLKESLKKVGFEQSDSDECLYVKQEQMDSQFLVCHVDDLLLSSSSLSALEATVAKLSEPRNQKSR